MALLVVLAGCNAPAPTLDALFGRATIPPPRPGETLAELPAEPYYDDEGPTDRRAADDRAGLTPPGGRFERSSLASRPRSAASSSADADWRESAAEEEEEEPRRLRAASPDEAGPSARSGTSIRPRSTTLQTTSSPPSRVVRVRPASARITTAAADSVPARAASVRTRDNEDESDDEDELESNRPARRVTPLSDRYGFDADYRWLRGRLEHFRSTNRWKLRYIPIDGQTDEFGGSVVLEDSPLLEDHQSGDFVQVRGELVGDGIDAQSYAPRYRADRIDPAGQ
jgi:hypothetical protein